ncbi:MAG: glycosyltransferase [Chitinivibrionales bacterium]|nr:glycosyltransferase [Chitinivibrionales bacterium]
MNILTNQPFPGQEGFSVKTYADFFHHPSGNAALTKTSFEELLRKLPREWTPDVFIFNNPFNYPLPENVEQSPIPTILILTDWFGSTDSLPDTLRTFDYIFTDRYSIDILVALGFKNVDYWPAFGFDPAVFKRFDAPERTTDIFFAGNFNPNIQTERLPWLKRISVFDKRFSVKIVTNCFGQEYVRQMNRARIVFNRSIKGEMNMRAFEAPACGALLFMEEENREIREFLTPGKECITYNNENLEDLLEYYCTHTTESNAISQAGYETIQHFSFPRLFQSLLDKITEKNITAGSGRSSRLSYARSTGHRDLVHQSLAIAGRDKSTISKLSQLVSSSADSHLFNDCGVILMAFAEDCAAQNGFDEPTVHHLVELSINLLHKAHVINTGYITPVFNSAQIYLELKESDKALAQYRRLLTWQPPDAIPSQRGLLYPLHYKTPLRYRWAKLFVDSIDDDDQLNTQRLRYLKGWSTYQYAVHVRDQLTPAELVDCFTRADDLMPHCIAISREKALALENNAQMKEAKSAYESLLSTQPFDFDMVKRYANLLFMQGEKEKAQKIVDESVLALQRISFKSDELLDVFTAFQEFLKNAAEPVH